MSTRARLRLLAGRIAIGTGLVNNPLTRSRRSWLSRRLRGYMRDAIQGRTTLEGWVEVPSLGLRFYVNLCDWLIRPYVVDAVPLYEQMDIRTARRWVQRGSTVVDVGANHGSWGLSLLEAAGPTGRAVLVEPNPTLVRRLHLSGRGRRVHVVPAALGAVDGGSVTLYLGDEVTSGSSSTTLHDYAVRHDHLTPSRHVTVPLRSLDAVLLELRIDRLDVLKIDVEFGEDEVVAGGSKSIRELRPRLVVLESSLRTAASRELQGMGYTPLRLLGEDLEVPEAEYWGNLFFVR